MWTVIELKITLTQIGLYVANTLVGELGRS